jgi:hypothetical protein
VEKNNKVEKVDFLFKYPTRGRPKLFTKTFDTWQELLSKEHSYKFVVNMDKSDPSMNNTRIKRFLESKSNTLYFYSNNRNKVQAINSEMNHIMNSIDFSILVLVSDDMIPQMPSYDDIIYQNFQKHFPDFDGCLHFNDGRVGDRLNTLVIMGRPLYNRFGYIYHPSYMSLWCDNEFHDVTYKMNKAKYIDKVVIKHEWTKYTGKDFIHVKSESFFKRDKKMYENRKAQGFPRL